MSSTIAPVTALPPRFAWHVIDIERGAQLRLDGVEVIAVVGCSAGRWHLTVNMHRGVDLVRWSYCASREQGMRWAERWIRPRADRVAAAIADRGNNSHAIKAPALTRDDKREERERRG